MLKGQEVAVTRLRRELKLDTDAVQGTFNSLVNSGQLNNYVKNKILVIIDHSMKVGALKTVLEMDDFGKGVEHESVS